MSKNRTDISRGKLSWKHSIYKVTPRPVDSENSASDSDSKIKEDVVTPTDNNLILCLKHDRYSEIIDTEVQKLLNSPNQTLTAIAETIVETIRRDGVTCFKPPFAQPYAGVQNIDG